MYKNIAWRFTLLMIVALMLTACAPFVRNQRRNVIEQGKIKAGMSLNEVVELMGYSTRELNYAGGGYLCIPYPIDWHFRYSYTWASFLFRNKKLISYDTRATGSSSEAFEGCKYLRMEARKNDPSATHKYLYKIVNFKSDPISGADIKYLGYDKEKLVKQGTVSTDFNGEACIEVNTTAFPKYATNITYVIQKNEYLQKKGNNSIDTDGDGQKYDKVQLSSMNDYFCDTLIDRNTYGLLHQTVRDFLHQVIAEGLLADSFLTKESICLETFKGKRYVSFTFASGNVYNSLKMDKYDMGKRLFDEVVRKVLGPMNDFMKLNQEFDGYKLTLNAHTKSFLDKLSKTEEVIYDFYLPKDAVSAYKDKDIAGQALLDRSIILMNDERVEFRLQ